MAENIFAAASDIVSIDDLILMEPDAAKKALEASFLILGSRENPIYRGSQGTANFISDLNLQLGLEEGVAEGIVVEDWDALQKE